MRRQPLVALGAAALLGSALLLVVRAAGGEAEAQEAASAREFDEPIELLMSDREAAVYRDLENPRSRDRFIERFWNEQDELPRVAWERRLRLARDQFDDLRSERARLFLMAGAPLFRLADICPPPVVPHEIWHYAEDGSKSVVFVQEAGAGYRPWRRGDWPALFEADPPENPEEALTATCDRGAELLAALESESRPAVDRDFETPWVDGFLAETTLLPEGASRFDATLDFEFPTSLGDKTATLLILGVPGYEGTAGAPASRSMILTGEIYSAPERQFADEFRFLYSGTAEGEDGVRLSARRHLAPGRYEAVLKLHDLARNRYFHAVREFDVPSVVARETPRVESARRIFKLLPPPEGYLIGTQRFETMVAGHEISKVGFSLDGQHVMTKNRSPFSLELDLGHVPRPREVEAVAYDGAGAEVARDRIRVNSGPHRFAVRLVQPIAGSRTRPGMQVHAEVGTPLGEKLSHVDFYFNERHMARLYQPPFVHSFDPPEAPGSAFVRAVGVLEDGHSAEDLVVLNTSSTVEAIDVDFVEIYASVIDRDGNAVLGLERDAFRIFEDDLEQEIRRFETVDSLPVNALVVLDSSESMIEEIDDAEEAAAQFFESVLEPKDRAAVMVFNDTPLLRVGLTNNPVLLKNGLAGVVAGGETSLYDTLVYGLYYLAGLRGKRALILISDGADSVSEFTLEDALDYARRSGVAIYTIALGLTKRDLEAQGILRRLARETGGESFSIPNARRLDRIYGQIERELRSQYLIGYQSPQVEDDDFRHVRVEIDGDGLEVKSVPGYYP